MTAIQLDAEGETSAAATPVGPIYSVNGIDMYVAIAGSGPDVLLLHGFPDSHDLWRNQVPALVSAGFRVIVPDLRGYGQTQIPSGGVASYRIETLVADVAALLDALGVKKVRLVAHDWGAVIGWVFAIAHPERVDRYVALSVGHPTAYARGGLRQKLMGWYVLAISASRPRRMALQPQRFRAARGLHQVPPRAAELARQSRPAWTLHLSDELVPRQPEPHSAVRPRRGESSRHGSSGVRATLPSSSGR